MKDPIAISKAFSAVMEFAISTGAESIKDLPGCWESEIDAHWWVAVNGHREDMKCTHDVTVPPFSVYVEFNGWPAGIFNAAGGTIAAGAVANEDALIEAALAAARGEVKK